MFCKHLDVDQDDRDVVDATVGQCGRDERVGGFTDVALAEQHRDTGIVNHVGQTIGAQQQPVSRREIEAHDIGGDRAVETERLGDVAAKTVVAGQWTELGVGHQVGAAVTNMDHGGFVVVDGCDDHGGGHASAFSVIAGLCEHGLMSHQQSRRQPLAGLLALGRTAGQCLTQARDGSLTREVPTRMTAEAVGDGNDTNRLLDEQGILVATSDVADFGACCNLHATTVAKPPGWDPQRSTATIGTMPSSTALPARTPATTPVPARLFLLAIVLVAVNLRAVLASLPPLVHTIQADLGLSGAAAGLLTTLPVLCMGVFAPVSQRLARVIGREATVGVALVLLLVGLAMRVAGSVIPLLFLSTLLAGIGIALCGTVLPGIVKEFFGHRPGIVTGVYLLSMMVGATAASALAVPLSHALGSWERSLAAWSLLAVVGLVAWLPIMRAVNDHDEPVEPAPATTTALPWRSPTAWLLAGYLAMQSFAFYSQLAWISPSYEDRGWSARDAGLLLALWSIVQLVSGLGAPVLADRFTDRRPLVAASVLCGIVGLLGCS